jgi:hypothetical protein
MYEKIPQYCIDFCLVFLGILGFQIETKRIFNIIKISTSLPQHWLGM